ncbi:1-acyl-sn-glycerol-3-phosphate acyltransferase [Cesiribacter andamanensis]|uniref:Glycerol-3-phosphate acyltransferase n=1 Tax=Cesiribacter andamanensis AMV16 TaxID=1279009 RepID=M7MYP8_9BACT|nr:1-acyl-sn-glycerol-3-phosphate acyltransferase [Cesiribacter andamanensis]EMR01583.1 Glycerol-3-phosphate acyltransferase [Cesiribacter andamanensis AMV16]
MHPKPEPIEYTKKIYKPIIARAEYWPVMQLSRNRRSFIEEVTEASIERILETKPTRAALIEELETTLHREKHRIKQNAWAVDPEDDAEFWGEVQKLLVTISSDTNGKTTGQEKELLRRILYRYVEEIAGSFQHNSYRFARRAITFGFSRLLNASRVKGFSSLWSNQYSLQDKLHIAGETDHIRSLAQKGVVVMVPTHFSNLDSILIGWVIHVLGLPPFIYGAGLNLFNIGVIAYFMNSLGAYKVDRRKKNVIYLEALKTYSSLAIQKGCHSLFFPGGTRSRSGKIEKRLKLGLLSSAMEAQREMYQKEQKGGEPARKVFIVPVSLNYNFVLEAPSLINEYLKIKGQERYYVETDRYSNSYKIMKFLLKFFTRGSDISVSIGRGMDLLGNYVDDEGNSYDNNGKVIETRDYFVSNGEVTKDKQREQEYTRMLSEAIVLEYHRINRVFPSHLVAFVAFEMLQKKYDKLDLFSLLRLSEEELTIPYADFKATFERMRDVVVRMYHQNKIHVDPNLMGDVDKVITYGLKNVGMYHSKRTLMRDKRGDITTEDMNTLFYYHNRLVGYELEQHI